MLQRQPTIPDDLEYISAPPALPQDAIPVPIVDPAPTDNSPRQHANAAAIEDNGEIVTVKDLNTFFPHGLEGMMKELAEKYGAELTDRQLEGIKDQLTSGIQHERYVGSENFLAALGGTDDSEVIYVKDPKHIKNILRYQETRMKLKEEKKVKKLTGRKPIKVRQRRLLRMIFELAAKNPKAITFGQNGETVDAYSGNELVMTIPLVDAC